MKALLWILATLSMIGILAASSPVATQDGYLTRAAAINLSDARYLQQSEDVKRLVPLSTIPFWTANGWTPAYSFNVYRNDNGGAWSTDFDAVSTLPSGWLNRTNYPACYADPVGGANSNSGETSAAPKRDLNACITINTGIYSNSGTARPRVIYVKAGSDFRIGDSATRGVGWNGVSLVADTIILTYGDNGGTRGTARWTSSNEMPERTWSLDQGTTWTASVPSTAGFVFDRNLLDAVGNGRRYTSVADVATVRTTPYSYYSTSSVIHINTNSTTAPNSNIDVVRSVSNGVTGDNDFNLWCFNATFNYGLRPFYVNMAEGSSNTPIHVFDNCVFERGTGTDGFRVEGPAETYLNNCIIRWSESDGANYRYAGKAFEFGVYSYGNGALSTSKFGDYRSSTSYNSNQGSTTHDDHKVFRVRCRFTKNGGQGIFDTGAGGTFTYSWNLGCWAWDQRGDATTSKRDADFGGGSQAGDVIYLIDPKPWNPILNRTSQTFYWLSMEQGNVYTDRDYTGTKSELLAGGAVKNLY
jgi:hypothetical protein